MADDAFCFLRPHLIAKQKHRKADAHAKMKSTPTAMLRSPKPIAFLQHDYGVGINDALLHDRKWMQGSILQHWEQHESAPPNRM